MCSNRRMMQNFSTPYHHIITSIKDSGLILDEDQICIDYHYNPLEYSEERKSRMLQVTLGLGMLLGIGLGLKKQSFLYTAVCLTPGAIIGIRHYAHTSQRKKQKQTAETLIKILVQNAKLLRSIREYLKTKNLAYSDVKAFDSWTQSVQQLIEVTFREEVCILHELRNQLQQFSVPSPLKEDFAYIDDVVMEDLSGSNVHSIEDAIIYLQKVSDVFVLFASNCLTCLALILSPKFWDQHDINLDQILDTAVPTLKNNVFNHYVSISKKFDNIKYCHLTAKQKENPKRNLKASSNKKLYEGTYNMLVHSNDILEKSRIIMAELEKVDLEDVTQKQALGAYISELRGHAFDYYEALDLLSKLYGISLNQPKTQIGLESQTTSIQTSLLSSESTFEDFSLNSTEPLQDEEYELHLGANEPVREEVNWNQQEEQEGQRQAFLISRELRRNLRRNPRFAAAQKKRGVHCEAIEEDLDSDSPPPPPKLNHCPLPRGVPLEDLPGNREPVPYTVNHFLDALKDVCQNRHVNEEVFGDSCED